LITVFLTQKSDIQASDIENRKNIIERLPFRHGERTLQKEGHQSSEESDIY
jgi:hypothetical protein